MLITAATAALLGVVILLIAWLPLHRMKDNELLTHTGVLEDLYTETHPNGRSTATYYCFVVDGETYYVSPIAWRALDRTGIKSLSSGTTLTLEYWDRMEAPQLEQNASDRELLSIASDSQVYMAREDCLQEKRDNGHIGIVLGCVFIALGAALPCVELLINRRLYRPSQHKRRR